MITGGVAVKIKGPELGFFFFKKQRFKGLRNGLFSKKKLFRLQANTVVSLSLLLEPAITNDSSRRLVNLSK